MIHLIKLEWLLIRRRTSTWLVLLSSILVGILTPSILILAHEQLELAKTTQQDMGFYSGVQNFLGDTVADVVGRSLMLRNLYFVPFLLLLNTGESYATERTNNNMRELLCFPVSRVEIYGAKMSVLGLIAFLSLLFTALPGFMIVGQTFENWGEWQSLCLGYLLCWVSDLTLFGIGAAIASFCRSGGTTAILTIFLLLMDLTLRSYLRLSTFIGNEENGLDAYLLGSALSSWQNWEQGFLIAPIISLLIFLFASHSFAVWRFIRQPV